MWRVADQQPIPIVDQKRLADCQYRQHHSHGEITAQFLEAGANLHFANRSVASSSDHGESGTTVPVVDPSRLADHLYRRRHSQHVEITDCLLALNKPMPIVDPSRHADTMYRRWHSHASLVDCNVNGGDIMIVSSGGVVKLNHGNMNADLHRYANSERGQVIACIGCGKATILADGQLELHNGSVKVLSGLQCVSGLCCMCMRPTLPNLVWTADSRLNPSVIHHSHLGDVGNYCKCVIVQHSKITCVVDHVPSFFDALAKPVSVAIEDGANRLCLFATNGILMPTPQLLQQSNELAYNMKFIWKLIEWENVGRLLSSPSLRRRPGTFYSRFFLSRTG
jgi:hypothetical protein